MFSLKGNSMGMVGHFLRKEDKLNWARTKKIFHESANEKELYIRGPTG